MAQASLIELPLASDVRARLSALADAPEPYGQGDTQATKAAKRVQNLSEEDTMKLLLKELEELGM